MLAGRKVLPTGVTGRIGGAIATDFAASCELWGLARHHQAGAFEAAGERRGSDLTIGGRE